VTQVRGLTPPFPWWEVLADRPSMPVLFTLLYVPLAVLGVFLGRATFFGSPIAEVGDYAANALQIIRAEQLSELLGNYSRFGFHHPGPAFFYVYGLADVLARQVLHVSQAAANAYLLGGLLLQLAFLAATVAVLASLVPSRRLLFAAAAAIIALVLLSRTDSPQWQVWPPYQLVLPFACFLATAIAVALGRARLLPLFVICGGFLVHGHVAQPLFVGPIAVIAYGCLFLALRRGPGLGIGRFLRATARPQLLAFGIVVLFTLPILIDALGGPDSNLQRILAAVGQGSRGATWAGAVFYVLQLWDLHGRNAAGLLDVPPGERLAFLAGAWPLLGGWSLLLGGAAVAIFRRPLQAPPIAEVEGRRVSGRRFIAVYYGLLAVATVLTLQWARMQQDGLYAFNAFFFNGVLLVAALPPMFVLVSMVPAPRRLAGALAAAGLALAVVQPLPFQGVTTLGGAPGDQTGPQLDAAVAKVLAERGGAAKPILLHFEPADWPMAVAVALDLERHGATYLVDPSWGFMFGDEHVYPGSSLVVGRPQPVVWALAHTGAIPLTPAFAIASIGLAGP
jgi:hypothetical protein